MVIINAKEPNTLWQYLLATLMYYNHLRKQKYLFSTNQHANCKQRETVKHQQPITHSGEGMLKVPRCGQTNTNRELSLVQALEISLSLSLSHLAASSEHVPSKHNQMSWLT